VFKLVFFYLCKTYNHPYTKHLNQCHLVRPCIWLGTTYPCNPPHYDLWVNLFFFTICLHCINIVFCPCYLFLEWNVLKCIALCLVTLVVAACFLHLCACFTFTHCLPTIICVLLIDVYRVFLFWMYFSLVWFFVYVSICVSIVASCDNTCR